VTVTLARIVQTCIVCPSQWNAWTTDGQYLYLRYRWGRGTVDAYGSPDNETWDHIPDGSLARFGDGFNERSLDGEITLEDFCAQAGLTIAPDAEVVPL
jgi:hypothetical protein